MNKFLISNVIAACDAYLLTGNTISERAKVTHTQLVRDYAVALQREGQILVYLSVDDLATIAHYYVRLP